MTYELTCINCPMGCRITAEYDGKEVTNIQGYTCARGRHMPRRKSPTPPAWSRRFAASMERTNLYV